LKLQDFLPCLCLGKSGEVFLEMHIQDLDIRNRAGQHLAAFKGESLWLMNRHLVTCMGETLYCYFNPCYKDENTFFPPPPIKGVRWSFNKNHNYWFANIMELL